MGEEIKMEISIIIPVYNAEKSIERCLNSLCNQTFKDFEAVIVNDGSKDNSLNICQTYLDKLNMNIITIENNGVSNARNVGLSAAKGNYICFIDSDDYITNDCLELLYTKIKTGNYDMVISSYFDLTEKGMSEHKVSNEENRQLFYEQLILQGDINHPWGKIFIANKIHHLFDTNLSIGEDLKFNLEYLTKDSRIGIVEKPLYIYDNMTGASLSKNNIKKIKGLLNEYRRTFDFCNMKELNCLFLNNLYVSRQFQYLQVQYELSNSYLDFSSFYNEVREAVKELSLFIFKKELSIKYRVMVCMLLFLPKRILYFVVKHKS